MEKCPTCNAKYKGKKRCYRCKTDLSLLIDIENQAEEHMEKAHEAFNAKDFNQMFFHAQRACNLRRTRESEKLLACASVFLKKFNLAVSMWNR